MKTYSAKKGDVAIKWFVIDLEGKVLGRAATKIANILRGKNKPQFTPCEDVGDFVIVLNAAKVKLTGNKLAQKNYYWHTGYPGGLKEISYGKLILTKPEKIISEAVKGMLPKNILGRRMLTKLKIFAGNEHPHAAQMPEVLN